MRGQWAGMGLESAVISSRLSPRLESGTVSTKTAVILPLEKSADETWLQLRAKTRNMVRKAANTGLTAERGFHNLRQFYDIYETRMLSMGVPIYGYSLFNAICETFGDDSELIVARLNGKMVGGLLLIFGKATAAYPFQATIASYMVTAATQFLIWEAVVSGVNRGMNRIDMGESRDGSPVYKSKVNFGGRPEPVYYLALSSSDENRQGNEPGEEKSGPSSKVTPQPGLLAQAPEYLMNSSPLWARKPIGLWLKRQGRLLF